MRVIAGSSCDRRQPAGRSQVVEIGPLVALALTKAGELLLAFGSLAARLDAGVDPLLLALLDQLLLGLLAGGIQLGLFGIPVFYRGQQAGREAATEQQYGNFHGFSPEGGVPR